MARLGRLHPLICRGLRGPGHDAIAGGTLASPDSAAGGSGRHRCFSDVLAQPPLLDSPELRQAAGRVRVDFPEVAGRSDVQLIEEARMRGVITIRWRLKGGAYGPLALGAMIILLAAIDM